ncbi:MAG: hypothetical protein A2044_04145 [Candidatus Firestonebacteria bacterium GWA2_43_8]|nr:MAG: hypothetical protein A2044_04145 [Candidatus Firestonebacteria bacterium GWA2_43_8]
MDKMKIVRECEFFKCLSNIELFSICKLLTEMTYEKGDTIFYEGDKSDFIYVVAEGIVKTTQYSMNGKESILEIFIKGDMIEPAYMFLGTSYPYSAIALNNASVLAVRKELLLGVLEKKPEMIMQATKNMSRKLLSSYCKLQERTTEKVEQRIARILLVLLKKTGNNLLFTREEIANMVGTTFETVIRFTSRIKKDRIIETGKRNIRILNEEKLRMVAEGFAGNTGKSNRSAEIESGLLVCNLL